jgi:hypothetical protein
VVTCLTDASAKDTADPPHDECAATGRIQHSINVKSSLRKRSRSARTSISTILPLTVNPRPRRADLRE